MNEALHDTYSSPREPSASHSGDATRMIEQGLTAAQAAAQLAADGPNELPRTGTRPAWKIVAEVLREPMFALLLAGGGVYLLLGDRIEALILLGFASFSIVLTVVQETRTEHVLEALRDLASPRALVIRDGAPLCLSLIHISEPTRPY